MFIPATFVYVDSGTGFDRQVRAAGQAGMPALMGREGSGAQHEEEQIPRRFASRDDTVWMVACTIGDRPEACRYLGEGKGQAPGSAMRRLACSGMKAISF